VTGVDADLATQGEPTFEQMADWWLTGQLIAAPSDLIRGLLAELSRLREERDATNQMGYSAGYAAGREAEQAWCARLQQALERIGWHELTWKEARDTAREALAGPDTPADSQEDKT